VPHRAAQPNWSVTRLTKSPADLPGGSQTKFGNRNARHSSDGKSIGLFTFERLPDYPEKFHRDVGQLTDTRAELLFAVRVSSPSDGVVCDHWPGPVWPGFFCGELRSLLNKPPIVACATLGLPDVGLIDAAQKIWTGEDDRRLLELRRAGRTSIPSPRS
jgi:hypothetical protein